MEKETKPEMTAEEFLRCWIEDKEGITLAQQHLRSVIRGETSELLKQRDELRDALRNACKFIKCTPHLKHDEDRPRGLERWESLAEAAIKNTER